MSCHCFGCTDPLGLDPCSEVNLTPFGTRRTVNGKVEVYGPDPWAYIYNFPCWFYLDAYVKDFGEEPPLPK